MKYLLLILSISLFQGTWINFEPPNMGVRVYVPAEMDSKAIEIETDLGIVNLYSYSHQQVEDPGNIFMLNLNLYEEGTFHPDSTSLNSEFLETTLEELLTNLKGELDYSEPFKIQKHLALKYRMKYNQNGTIAKGKMVLKNDILYIVQVFTSSEKSLNEDMELYLNSFKMLEE